MLVLLTRILLWASVGLLIWYFLSRIIPRKYLAWFGGVILIMILMVSFVEPESTTVQAVWKILIFPLTPLGLSIVLLGSSLSDGLNKPRGNNVAIALGILLFFSVPLIAQSFVSDAEQKIRTSFQERAEICGDFCSEDELASRRGSLRNARAIVVFGDSSSIDRAITLTETDNELSTNTTLAPRLVYAANLYDQASVGGRTYVFVTAGRAGDDDSASSQRQTIQDILRNNGVISEDIRVETSGLDIRKTAGIVENFLQDSQVIESRDRRIEVKDDPRVVLVAPAIEMSRAALTFENMGLEVIAKPTDFYTTPQVLTGGALDKLSLIIPSVDALQLSTRYWNELLTSLYYFLRGWLPDFNFGWGPSIEI